MMKKGPAEGPFSVSSTRVHLGHVRRFLRHRFGVKNVLKSRARQSLFLQLIQGVQEKKFHANA